jgi:gamma-glutamyltranspeptidase/glutathione hydrolase
MEIHAPFPSVRAPTAMVCTIDGVATLAGLGILQAGGSAADAAVAASAVLAVTSPHACGMGGDLLAVVHPGPGRRPEALNASGRSGSGADADRLRADGFTAMPFRDDIRSVPVPGCVDGWVALHARHGRLPIEQVLEPARRYATEGFCASPGLLASLTLARSLRQHPDAADFDGASRAGQLVRRPGVGRALAAIGEAGRDGFYLGEFGNNLLALGAGEYQPDDLATPQAEWVTALDAPAWGHRLWTVPPNSQGYLTLAGAAIASGLDLPADPDDPGWAHLLVEAARQAGWDRTAVLWEGAVGSDLVAEAHLARRRAAIDSDRTVAISGEAPYGGGGTIGLTVVDGDRMGVSLLQSNAAGFGSHLIVPGVRIFLQNRGIGFSLVPGHRAEYGPRRRPPHTLSPLLVTDDDGTALSAAAATMGGDSQPQILLQLIARLLVSGQSPGPAMAAARFALTSPQPRTGFDTWSERGQVRVLVEGHAPVAWSSGLAARGHEVVPVAPFESAFGHAHLIAVRDDHLAGAADPRPRTALAAGY